MLLRYRVLVLNLVLAFFIVGCKCDGSHLSELDTEQENYGYALGVQRGSALKQQLSSILIGEEVAKGLISFYENKEEYTNEERSEVLREFNQFMRKYFADKTLKYDQDPKKISQILGRQFGQALKSQYKSHVSYKALAQGMSDAFTLSDEKLLLPREQVSKLITELDAKMQGPSTKEDKKMLDEGKKFLEENKSKEDIKTTGSGLQYQVLREGTGEKPKPEDSVTVHYRGMLINGTEFDSSYSRGTPATFGVQGVIKGWTEALMLMKKGAKYKLFIPEELAYGHRGSPPKIPPFSTLVFDVELIEVSSSK